VQTKALFGKKAICQYLDISEYTFGKFIRRGMPARFEESRWFAHKDNLDSYFEKLTKHQEGKDHEEQGVGSFEVP
jgi:hypothetical protein